MSFTKRVSALAIPAFFGLSAVLLGCPANTKMSVPPGAPARVADRPPVAPTEPSPGIIDAFPDVSPDAGIVSADAMTEVSTAVVAVPLPDGSACDSSESCQSGLCEGGCDVENQAVCVPANRACLLDRVLFCSCEGETFSASSTCPGRRFQSKGKCKPEVPESP